jgi:RNA polymerase sigma-70 factor (ECF subfamily)
MEKLPERLSTDELFRLYAPFVARMLYRLGVPSGEVDDVVQQVFMVAHRNGGYVRGPATPKSYLGSIAVKAASSARRRDRAQRTRTDAAAPESLGSGGRDAVTLLETNQDLEQLRQALGMMDPDLAALLVLVEVEGESCAAIAASQGSPVGTVYWRVHRARKQFRDQVKQLNDALSLKARAEGQSHEPCP